MKSKNLTLKKSKSAAIINWDLVDKSPKSDVPDQDSPELTSKNLAKMRPLNDVLNIGKTRITIMLDESIVQSYKQKASGRGYQTLINETLRKGLEIDSIKDALREVLQEKR